MFIMGVIDFNKIIDYSKKQCKIKSIGRCATYVKNAFAVGGCKYISGNGWSNQSWCTQNGFVCIGEISYDELARRGYNVRAHGNFDMWLPTDYVQQLGDVCLIKHGKYGHICYAMSDNINDWVSDFFQRPPSVQPGTGPYCYSGKYEGVQFWRHESVLNGAPRVTTSDDSPRTNYVELPADEIKETTNQESNRTNEMSSLNQSDSKKKVKGIILGTNLRQGN